MVDHKMVFGERRRCGRKSCSRMVEIDDYRSLIKGHLRNLTSEGAFIEPASRLDAVIGQELTLTIPYGLKRGKLTAKAKVAWITDEGVGVRFLSSGMY